MKYQIWLCDFKGVGLHYSRFIPNTPALTTANADSASKFPKNFTKLRRLG